MNQNIFRYRGIGAIGIVAMIGATVLGVSYVREKNRRAQRTQSEVRAEADRAARSIDTAASRLMGVVQSIADSLTADAYSEDELLETFESVLEQYTRVHSVGAAYAPHVYSEDSRLFAPFFVREGDVVRFTRIDSVYDYTSFDVEWYRRPFRGGAMWLNPFFDEASGDILVTYAAPFFPARADSGAIARGVVVAHVSLEMIREVISSLDIGRTGFALLVTRDASVLYHPVRKYVTEGQTVIERMRQAGRDEAEIAELTAILEAGGRGDLESVTSGATGRRAWVSYIGLPATKWVLWTNAFEDEYLTQTPGMYHKLLWMGLAVLLAVCCFGLIAVGAHHGGPKRLIAAATLVSLAILAGIGYIWYLALVDPPIDPAEDVAVTSEYEAYRYLRRTLGSSLEKIAEEPLYVSTGVFVLSMSFPSANEVVLNGYIWQHYPYDTPADLPRGFLIPDDVSPIRRVTEAYRDSTEDGELIGWKFRAQLRLEFDYSRYPFDSHTVSLRLWHPDLQRQVILVPDFDAYDLINPTALPGITDRLVLPGWGFRRSHFDYSVNHYNASFGLQSTTRSLDWPELQFNFVIQRDFLNSMINVLSRPFVVAFLLFGLLLLARRKEELKLLGFSAAGIIGTGGGFMLLVLAGDQMNLRKTIAAVGIAYAEFCFFALYALILLVVISAVLYAYDVKSRFVQYEDNLIPKLLYWPLFLTLLLAATLWSFY